MNPGDRVGSYELVQEIGRGGMGAVWLAEHALLRNRAVIKLLLPELASHPEIVQRFFAEAKAAAAIDSPAVVKVFHMDTMPDGTPYIVMEHLRGRSLERFLEQVGAVPEPVARAIGARVAGVLALAHEKGIVHRDLKPPNVFLVTDTEDRGTARVKVLDFGIAKLMEGSDVEAKVQTKTGAVLGTPFYMSPEQGTGETVDARTDIYALGVMLYEMLTGSVPFQAKSTGGVIAKHVSAAPVPPRDKDPRISEDLEAIVLRCLAKLPEQRFQTMEELEAALAPDGVLAPIPADGSHSGPRTARAGSLAAAVAGTQPSGPKTATLPAETQRARPASGQSLAAAESIPNAAPARRRGVGWLVAVGAVVLATASASVLWLGGFVGGDDDAELDVPAPRAAKDVRSAARDAAELHAPSSPAPARADSTVAASAPATGTEAAPTPAPAPAPPAAAATPRVILRIESVPTGASVDDAGTGEHLGETPYELETTPGARKPRLRLSLAGFAPAEVSPPTARSDTTIVRLRHKAGAKAAKTAGPTGSAGPRTASSRGID
ncbi:MAG TPA: protein kinase [Myxococcota bacterium]|nr:protein kinase [Myxococcota bacterium]